MSPRAAKPTPHCPRRGHAVDGASTQGPLTQSSPVTLTYDNGKGLKFTRTISVDDKYMFTIDDMVANTGSDPVTLYPYALVSRHGIPEVKAYYILHEGLIGVVDNGLEEISYKKAAANPPQSFKSKEGWLGITDKYWAAVVIPEQGKPFEAKFSGTQGDGHASLPGRLSHGCGESGARRDGRDQRARLCRRQGGQPRRSLRREREHPEIRPPDRLGLVLLPDQADVFRARLFLQARRQFRRGHPHRHVLHQARALPARQQILRVDEQDEEARAGDAAHQGALRRRPRAPAAGDDGAVQEGEGEPGVGLFADPRADPDLLRPLQGAVRHHRDAACALLRLDQGPLGARSRPPCSTCSG